MSLLDFFISPAAAQAAAPAQQQSPMVGVVMMLVLVGVMYFLMIRPQMKRQKEHQNLVSKLAKGDEVITSGGIAGLVVDLGDNFITVEVADGVRLKVQRSHIAATLPKGTLKSA